MRKVVAIGLLFIIVFWMVYGLLEPFRTIVNNFMLKTVGPTITGVIVSVGTSPFWVQYGSFIMLGVGFTVGLLVYRLWYQGKWGLRKWGIAGAAKDLGAVGVSNIPATPLGATVRPAVQETQPTTKLVSPSEEEPKPEEPS